MSKLVY